MVRRVLPVGLRRRIWRAICALDHRKTSWRLARLRRRMFANPPRTSGVEQCFCYTIRINDGPNFYLLYKDIFLKHIYHFGAQRPDPLILDCGSNIGTSILHFKHVYPQARIIGFEPDPAIFPCLQENITHNDVTAMQLVQAAVAGKEGMLTFYSDGKYGSCLAEHLPADIPQGWTKYEVPCVRLRDYLTGPLDFLKMNIEGAEWEALRDSEDRLRQIREMVIEYHHLPGLPHTLHEILSLLHRKGFECVVSDFDVETYAGARQEERLSSNARYYRQVYAWRGANGI